MNKIVGMWYALSYKLETHYLGQVSLSGWLWAEILVPLVLAAGRQLSWWYAVPLSLAGIALWGGARLARQKGYLRFTPGPVTLGVTPQSPLAVDEKVAVRVCGEFAVGDGKRRMCNESAFYTFVKTREHVLMVHLKRTRFLLLARSRSVEVGWWYVFFKPERIVSIQSGRIADGLGSHAGLALTFHPDASAAIATVYVACEDKSTLERIIQDLERDAPREACRSFASG